MMILRLILKDVKAHGKTIILNFLALLILGNIFVFRYYPWHVYMMYGYLTLAFLGSFISFKAINKNIEVLTCSLPVRRSGIVTARYLISAIITFCGLALWYLNGFIGSLLYTDASTDFHPVAQSKVVFMALLFTDCCSIGIYLKFYVSPAPWPL
jgi:hypothetical protein